MAETAPGRAVGASTWWATPAVPEHHYSERELARSDAYHRPLRTVGLLGLGARIALLTGAALVAGGIGGDADATVARAATGAALTVVPLRVVSIAGDTWFEYRHQRRRPEHQPVPPAWFAAVGLALTTLALAVATAAAVAGYRLAAATDRWPAVLAGVAVAAVASFVVLERPVRGLMARSRERALVGAPADRFADLAASFDLAALPFMVRPGIGDDAAPPVDGLDPLTTQRGANAYATGLGPNRRVVVAETLLDEEPPMRDFVVAHELTHLARHHVLLQTALSTALIVAGVLGLGALVAAGVPWRWFGLDPLDPVGLPLVVLLGHLHLGVTGPLAAWAARSQERSADVGAIGAVGCPAPGEAARLHGGDTADLAPPRWLRLYAHHPPPYERLEFLARHRH